MERLGLNLEERFAGLREKFDSLNLRQRFGLDEQLSSLSAGEQTPLKADKASSKDKVWQPDASWLVFVVVAALSLGLLGSMLHSGHHPTQPLHLQRLPHAPRPQTPPQKIFQAPNIVEDFPKCNPTKIKVTPFEGPWCDSYQIREIRQLLDDLKYNFAAVSPDHNDYPAYILQNLLDAAPSKRGQLLRSIEKTANGMGKVGTLVKMFAWGLPVHAKELLSVFKEEIVVDAFMRCNIVSKCGSDSPMYAAAVQITPLQLDPVIVASDWSTTRNSTSWALAATDAHAGALAANIPNTDGMTVLDFGAGSGVLGLVAAARGAKNVVMLDPNPRAARFARFNTWLNGMNDKIEIIRRPLVQAEKIMDRKFSLLLTHVGGTPNQKEHWIASVLEQSERLLSPHGAFVLGFEGRACQNVIMDYNEALCKEFKDGVLTGNVVCQGDPKLNVQETYEGIVFGWKTPRWNGMREKQEFGECDHFRLHHMAAFTSQAGPKACQFAKKGMQCPHDKNSEHA
jgi:hypothetical protein